MKNVTVLDSVPLFRGIAPQEREALFTCLNAVERAYAAGAGVFRAGEPAERVGVVLEGAVQVVREEYSGARSILAGLGPGELFGEAFACASGELKTLPVSVVAVAESVVLLLDCRKIAKTCARSCPFHARLIENMLSVLADKDLLLNRRLGHLCKRSTREKLLSYLGEQAALHGGPAFDIPFDRQELADYLCVERSAMSAALGALRREGIISFQRAHFELHQDQNA